MDVQLKCSCGAVRGTALNVTPKNGNRVICCCDDCQNFATELERGAPTYPNASLKYPIGITMRIIRKMLIWKIRGMNKPSAFFTESGDAVVKPRTVS